ncbi:unnamed protein product, partial [Closterium sp. NIES-64]
WPAEGLPEFRPGEVWSVKVPGNSCPIAVGITMVGSAEAVRAGMRGKLLRITHYYRDSLWETAEGSYVPNKGFLPDLVVPDPDAEPVPSEGAAPEDSPDDSPDDDLGATGTGGGEGEAGRGEGRGDEEGEAGAVMEEGAAAATAAAAAAAAASSEHLSNHVLPCRPPGTTVDIKRSSHKKLSKWLHAKAVDGLISGKEDKHRKEFILSAVNYRHPTLIAFTPDKTNKPAQTPAAATLDASPAAPGAPTTTATTTTTTSSSGSGSSSSGGLTVEEVLKPTHHVSAIFEAGGLDPHAYYSPSAAREAALTKPSDPSIVILDAPLCDALYKGAIKKGATYPTECHKRELGPTIVKRIQAHHRVERASIGKSIVRKGGLVPVQILVERRQGNKKVTRVSRLEAYLVEAEPLAAQLQRKFASSTSMAEVPRGFWGNKKVTRVSGLEAYLVEAEPLAAELQRKFASSTSVAELPGGLGSVDRRAGGWQGWRLIWWRLSRWLLSCRGSSPRSRQLLKCQQMGVAGVSGLVEAYLMEAEPLAAELQRKFASSTLVAEVPGKKGQHEVLIQGGVLDQLARLLVDVHGIPKSHIEVLDKTRR